MPTLVVSRQVRTYNLPAIPAVCGHVDILTAHVNLIVVVWRNGDREFPVEPVLHFCGAGPGNIFGPHLDVARLSIALVEARHRSPDAPGPRAAGPNDVVVHRIRCRETAFAPCDRMPHTARDLSSTASTAPKARELQAIARPAVRWTVLLVAVNEIRNLIVHGYVIDLCYRQLNVVPRVAPIHRDAHASVIHYRHAISVRRIDPHFVVVPSRARGHVGQRVATVERS